MQKVLLVEDSEVFQEIVASALEGLGVSLLCVASASEAWSQLARENFDLILLDVLLPDENGFDLCARLQAQAKTRDIPIFLITGKKDVSDKVAGFAAGADDYIVKPFDLNELRARVGAKLAKLAKAGKAKRQSFLDSGYVTVGKMRIDVAGQKVFLGESSSKKAVSLTPAEFRILYHLARHAGEIVSGRQLMSAVWGEDLHVVEQNLYTHMHSLRKKLGSRASSIVSVRGGGYRLE
jgi:two-component system phosphate regulon response regulator PhoB